MLRSLAERADAIVENFRPGTSRPQASTTQRPGPSPRAHLRFDSGFGQHGPRSDEPDTMRWRRRKADS